MKQLKLAGAFVWVCLPARSMVSMHIKYVMQTTDLKGCLAVLTCSHWVLKASSSRHVLQNGCCIVVLSFEAFFQTYLGCHRASLRWSLW